MYENKEDEVVCYILMRTDLGMSPGKMVAQGGHAVQEMITDLYFSGENRTEWYCQWLSSNVKVVLAINSQKELDDLCIKISDAGYSINAIIDEGRTEIAPNTLTCAAIQPLPRKIAKEFVGHLKLLK